MPITSSFHARSTAIEVVTGHALEPHGGVLRFKPHDKRKTSTSNTGQRWGRGETDWDVIGG